MMLYGLSVIRISSFISCLNLASIHGAPMALKLATSSPSHRQSGLSDIGPSEQLTSELGSISLRDVDPTTTTSSTVNPIMISSEKTEGEGLVEPEKITNLISDVSSSKLPSKDGPVGKVRTDFETSHFHPLTQSPSIVSVKHYSFKSGKGLSDPEEESLSDSEEEWLNDPEELKKIARRHSDRYMWYKDYFEDSKLGNKDIENNPQRIMGTVGIKI